MPGEMVPVIVAGIDLLVIATIDGRSLYCIANSCPHLGTPLETGKLLRLPTEIKSPPLASETMTMTNSDGTDGIIFTETDLSNILSQDGCEDCIICPLHRTAFALKSGEVRGEWCPYPPVIGAIMGTVKTPTPAAVFEVRTRGKNIEVRLNSIL
jgi:nitrite reductase/ring-hydroxylating ferredoxin subunit